jgi:hypothetical protein
MLKNTFWHDNYSGLNIQILQGEYELICTAISIVAFESYDNGF